MVSGRVMSAAGCSRCQASVLRLFLGPATPLIRAPLTSPTPWRTVVSSSSRTIRGYATASPSDEASAAKDISKDTTETEKLEAASEEQSSDHAAPATSSAHEDEPWYLQVEPPRHAPVSEPPPLPDVPEGSPAVVPELLKYAAEEMGLDELKLLDLRELDPPPALGANLFMLFGTARSERHLNVSAGRLVRWLRAKHRIYADADGLLGPNERKTKLRRKAKRARLLGTMGTDDFDDGITTGWICVNMGTINRSHMESAVVGEDGRVAGFGVPQTGSTIVVQVMTEARRTELGLEALWERTLAQQYKKQTKDLESGGDVDPQTSEKPVLSRVPPRPTLGTASSATSPFASQSRSYSTQTARRVDTEPPQATMPFEVDELYAFLTGNVAPSEISGLDTSGSSGSRAAALSQSLSDDGAAKVRMIELLQLHLQSLPPDQAFAALKSTPFLRVAKVAMHDMPAENTWGLRLSIEFKARQLGAAGYESLGLQGFGPLDKLKELIDQLRTFALPATRGDIQQLLSCIYASPGPTLNEQTSLAMELLESIHLRGDSVLHSDIVVAIVEGVSWSRKRTSQTDELLERLDSFIVEAKLPYIGEPLLIRLMESYARLKRWTAFWETWRIPPRYAQPRSRNMYLHLFKIAADSDHWICTTVLQQCYREMLLEDPVVQPTGEIYRALLACIHVVDPRAEQHASTSIHRISSESSITQTLARGEFVGLVKELQAFQQMRWRS
ncbi:Exopolyphosphatase [Pestalotiopsis sp. IQ-011]